MRRTLLTLALTGLFGAFAASDARACHKKKATCTPACEPVVMAAPCPPPVPVCEPVPTCAPAKKHHMSFKMPKMPKFKGFGGLCHKKAAPACAPVAYEAAPVHYATPQAPYASGQASHQGL